MKQKIDFNEGSVIKNILNLSWPVMVAFLLHAGFNLVDAYFVGKISASALAAVSVSFPFIFLMISLASGIGIGATSLISRLLGSKKKEEADNVAEHSLLLGVIIALIFMILGLFFAERIFEFAGASEEIMPMVLGYINVILWGSIFMFGMFMLNSILRGEGDTKTPMIALGASNILNTILDPIFIFGWGFIPSMGVKGAALATVISRTIAALFIFVYVFRGKSYIKLNIKDFRFKLRIIKDIFKVGIPASLSQMIMSIGMFFLIKVISFFGDSAIAAYGLAGRIESVAMLPLVAIGTATMTIVGYNVGAKAFKRAERTAWSAVLFGVIVSGVIGFLIFIFPYSLISLFNDNPEVISIGGGYLRIVSLTYILAAISITLGSAFQGAGKGFPALFASALRLLIIGIPLAYITAIKMGLGINWIWYSLIIGAFFTSLVIAIWFKMGTWKKGHHMAIGEIPVS